MSNSGYNRTTHFSIVWGITLALLTILEWRNLDREPMQEEILLPFITRDIAINLPQPDPVANADFGALFEPSEEPLAGLEYSVDIRFNGPLFLACFFGPILLFHAIAYVLGRFRQPD